MATGTTKASIVITAYNYEKYIAATIESCLKQNCSFGYEVIIVNDGSTDGTANVVHQYENQITFIDQQNGGIEKASNCGIRAAQGSYVVRVDADDILFPDYLNYGFNFRAQ